MIIMVTWGTIKGVMTICQPYSLASSYNLHISKATGESSYRL